MEIIKIFTQILESQDFKDKLQSINQNYPNLKQESFIRNALLEIINESYSHSNIRAFAEHPRENGRTDLSIVNKEKDKIFKIELKFQFTRDSRKFIKYGETIRKDFLDKKSDLFILIISRFDNLIHKIEFDKIWGISTNLSQYHSKTEEWRQNISTCFSEFIENTNLQEFEFRISKPYPTNYNFYLLNKKK